MKEKIARFVVSLALPHLAGGLGAVFTASSVSTWYAALEKPALNPPSWVFGPVWLGLYTLMGIALYLVWEQRKAFRLFLIHLVFNALWSILFFGLQNPLLALLNIIILWIMILILLIYSNF